MSCGCNKKKTQRNPVKQVTKSAPAEKSSNKSTRRIIKK